jgi:hypothetical protein
MSVDDFEDKTESFNEWVKKENVKADMIEMLRQAFIAGYDKGAHCRDKYNFFNLNQK